MKSHREHPRHRLWLAAIAVTLVSLFLTFSPSTSQAAMNAYLPEWSENLATDMSRYVGFMEADGTPVVWDTRAGEINPIEGAADCWPEQIGGRRVALGCPRQDFVGPPWEFDESLFDSGFRARTASVFGGASVPLPHADQLYAVFDIGNRWALVGAECFKGWPRSDGCDEDPSLFVNWRTGELREHFYWQRDLNSENLKLKPKPLPFAINYRKSPFPGLIAWNDEVIVARGSKGRLLLFRSKDRYRTISRTYFDTSTLRVGDPWITWTSNIWHEHDWKGNSFLRGFNYRTGKKFNRKFYGYGATIAPVRDGILIATRQGPSTGGTEPLGYNLELLRNP